jgi:predicted permease
MIQGSDEEHATGQIDSAFALQVLLASMRAVGTAAIVAGPGALLARNGVITPEVSKGISHLAIQVTIPCLLFTSVAPVVNSRVLRTCWPLMVLPFVWMGLGLLLGALVVRVTTPAPSFRSGAMAACAFGNSTGMPIVLLKVVHVGLRGGDDVDPIMFLSVYLIFYPILQWTVGAWLLGVDQSLAAAAPGTSRLGSSSPMAEGAARGLMLTQAAKGTVRTADGLESGADISSTSTSANSLAPRDDSAAPRRGEEAMPILNGVADAQRARFKARACAEGDDAAATGSDTLRLLSDEMAANAAADRAAVADASRLPTPLLLRDDMGMASSCAWRLCGAWRGASSSRLARAAEGALRQFLKPAVVAVLAAVVVGLTPALKELLLPTSSAPLGWAFDGVQRIGKAAVPLNLLLLGVSLSNGPSWADVFGATNIAIAVAKMVVMPLIAAAVVLVAGRAIPLDPRVHDELWLVGLVVTCTPTANNVMIMTEAAGLNKAAMGTSIFTQYLLAPVLMPINITLFALIVSYAV